MPGYAQKMADVRLGRPAIVAIGFAIVALVTSVVAVVVVMRREPKIVAAPIAAPAPPPARTVDATDVLKLKRDVVEKVEGGIRITDEALRTTFALAPDDIITAINGRTMAREFDVFDAILGASTMNASIVYLEVTRAGVSTVRRYEVEGELRTARRDTTRPNPFVAAHDPLADSIRKLDALQFEVPRSTLDALIVSPDRLMKQARMVPALRPPGLRLFGVRPGSIWAALEIGNGDTLRSINGSDLSTPDQVIQQLPELKDATALRIVVLRRNNAEDTVTVTIK